MTNRPIIGYLSPNGVMTYCDSYEHLYIAKSILKREYAEMGFNGLDAENKLLAKGYVCFRSRDCYMRLDKSLTEKQIEFINANENNWVNYDQASCVYELLETNIFEE